MKNNVMVDDVNERTMQGSTPLVKKVNAYLTRSFIGYRDLPSDECLSEAEQLCLFNKTVADKSRFEDFLELYLTYTFFDGTEKPIFKETARELLSIFAKNA